MQNLLLLHGSVLLGDAIGSLSDEEAQQLTRQCAKAVTDSIRDFNPLEVQFEVLQQQLTRMGFSSENPAAGILLQVDHQVLPERHPDLKSALQKALLLHHEGFDAIDVLATNHEGQVLWERPYCPPTELQHVLLIGLRRPVVFTARSTREMHHKIQRFCLEELTQSRIDVPAGTDLWERLKQEHPQMQLLQESQIDVR